MSRGSRYEGDTDGPPPPATTPAARPGPNGWDVIREQLPIEPPWGPSLRAQAGAGSEPAKRQLDRWHKGQRLRRRLLAVLAGSRVFDEHRVWELRREDSSRLRDETGQPVQCPDRETAEALRTQMAESLFGDELRVCERVSVEGVELPDGSIVATQGRSVRADWLADPQASARRIALCGVQTVATDDGRAVPMTCGDALCPSCRAESAAADAHRWSELVAELAELGYQVGSLTLTLPHTDDGETTRRPTVLTLHDQRRGYRAPEPEVVGDHVEGVPVGFPVPGESDRAMLERLRRDWRFARNKSTRGARLWQDVAGCIYGVESTGRRPLLRGLDDERQECTHCGHVQDWESGPQCLGCRGRWWPREHAHLHALVVLRPGVDRDDWWREWRALWCYVVTRAGHPGAAEAQHAAWLDGSTGEVASAAQEVLKYPCKLGERTDAQLVSWLAATKGTHWHQVCGAFHGCSRVGRLAKELRAADDPGDVDLADLAAWEAQLAQVLARWRRSHEDRPRVLVVRGWAAVAGGVAPRADRVGDRGECWCRSLADLAELGCMLATYGQLRQLTGRTDGRVCVSPWVDGRVSDVVYQVDPAQLLAACRTWWPPD